MPRYYILSLLDALRAVRAEHRMHQLSYLMAPAGKAAKCLACGATFDDYRDAEGECPGESSACGVEPVPGAVPVATSAVPMLERCFRHQHPEQFGRGYVGGAVLPAWAMARDNAVETPKVFNAPSDRGIDGVYLWPADQPAAVTTGGA